MLIAARITAFVFDGKPAGWLLAAAALLLGFGAECVNYAITKAAIKRGASAAYAIPLRVVAAGICMTVCYLASVWLGLSALPQLIGCAVGLSIGLLVFTILML